MRLADNMERVMKKLNLPDRLMKDIKSFAEKNEIERIILFGSRARGTHRRNSDVDLAVIGGDFEGFRADIQDKAHSLLSFDVAEYNESTSAELKAEIERDGVTIYEKVR